MKEALTLILFINILQLAYSQTHHNAWLRGTVSYPVNKSFRTDFELQYRSQNGYGNSSFFDKELMQSFRIWLKYKMKEGLSIEVSPFAYFIHHQIIIKEADQILKPTNEIRPSFAIEQSNALISRIQFIQRTALDFRFFSIPNNNLIRFREKLALRFELTKLFHFMLYDEILLNTSNVKAANLLDHNRLYLGSSIQLYPKLKIEIGYMKVQRLMRSTSFVINENNFVLNINYSLRKIMN